MVFVNSVFMGLFQWTPWFQAALIFLGAQMFSLKNNLKFITINQDYLKYLHSFCSEVYYKPTGYETKPYIRILVQEDDSNKARIVYGS